MVKARQNPSGPHQRRGEPGGESWHLPVFYDTAGPDDGDAGAAAAGTGVGSTSPK